MPTAEQSRNAAGRCVLSLAVVILATPAAAQQSDVPVGPLSLEQVLTLADERSETIAAARAGVQRASGDEMRARSGLLPQVSLSASYDRALASEFSGVFDNVALGGGGTDAGAGESGDDGGGFEDLPFGRANTWRISLALSQSLFSGGRVQAARALAAAGRESAALGVTSARAQLLFDVTQAYYDAALSERLVVIAEATLGQATATLQQTEAAFKAGTQPEFEVLRARVTRDTQNPALIRQRVNREVALLRLKQLLDLPPAYDLRLADVFGDDALAPAPVFATRVAAVETQMQAVDSVQAMLAAAAPLTERTAVRESATTVSLREASLAATRAQRMPTITGTTNYGRLAYPSGVFPTFDRSNWTIGVNLQVPLYTGGRQRGEEIVAQAELDQARVQLRQMEELAALDTRSAWAELLASRAAWEATAGTVQQASRAYEIAEVRYQAGVSTQLELSDSRLLLQQAEANRAQSARDLQVARARVALLPDLPVGNGAAPAGGGRQQAPSVPAQPVQPAQPAQGGGQIQNAAAQGGQQFGG